MDNNNEEQKEKSEITPFALTTYRNAEKVFGIKTDDRRRHVYLIGKTGMGKTTMIENMVYSDILAGRGVCYVDPHGDTAEKMLGWIPASRINDVIYFNPADLKFPISFNVLEKVDPEYRHLVASGLIGVFKKQWADSWGPRLEYILRHTIMALLEYPDSTLLGINRMLVDKVYNKKVLTKVTDPVVRSFWEDEYPKWNERVLQEVISPIQNKVGQFLSTALIRNIVGQVKSSINIRTIMDTNKILILNLSKGRIGEDSSNLLGAMMITKIQLAAMSRVDLPENERNDFYLYVDEFQNFVTEAFADILSEARKYHLNLIIAHQYIEQLGEVVQPAVFGNVGTIICFRVGAADAEFLEKEFLPYLTQEDLVNLPKYHVYLKLMIDGVSCEPFSARGLAPVFSDSLGNEDKAINVSRERYAKSREVVEDKIRRWSSTKDDKGGGQQNQSQPQNKQNFNNKNNQNNSGNQGQQTSQTQVSSQQNPDNKKKKGYEAVCYGCKKDIEIPFKPDNIRPTFCKDCLKKSRRGEIKIDTQPVEVKATQEGREIKKEISFDQMQGQTVGFKGNKTEVPKTQPSQPVKQPQVQKQSSQPVTQEKPQVQQQPYQPVKREQPQVQPQPPAQRQSSQLVKQEQPQIQQQPPVRQEQPKVQQQPSQPVKQPQPPAQRQSSQPVKQEQPRIQQQPTQPVKQERPKAQPLKTKQPVKEPDMDTKSQGSNLLDPSGEFKKEENSEKKSNDDGVSVNLLDNFNDNEDNVKPGEVIKL